MVIKEGYWRIKPASTFPRGRRGRVYRQRGNMVIADPAIRDEIVKRGVRESMRRTGLSQHTIEAICGGKAVRPATLLRVVQSQHTFDFLRGDPGKNGECRKLPVDAYYEQLKLVVEYRERQHTEAVPFFDRKATLSGCGRGEQRRRYDQHGGTFFVNRASR